MAVDRTGATENKQTGQSVLNTSYDQKFGVLVTEGLTYNPVADTLERSVVVGQGNPSLVLTYDGSDHITQIEKTIGGITYTKTLTWTGSNVTDISSWS